MNRQGDVLIIPVPKLPAGTKQQERNGRIILAHGEATGHAHAIADPDCEVLVSAGGKLFVRTKHEVAVEHEEHAPVTLSPGVHEVIRQREWMDEESRRVAD